MKEKLINLIRQGKLSKAFEEGESFLKIMNDHYYSWTMLQSKLNDVKNENTKGILNSEEFTRQMNLINSQLLDLILKLDNDLHIADTVPVEEQSFRDKLQNALLGSYEILKVLSDGPLSVNYKAKELFEDNMVVIKAMKFDGFVDVSSLFEEITRARQFNHRNIISVIGKSSIDANPKYVVLEYIGGTALNTIVTENGARPKGETRRVLLHLAQALYYLHKRKVFNADLQSTRIFMDKEGEPMMAPFILFKTQSESNYDQMVSNLQYMSLSRLRSKGYKNDHPRANQFSLGTLGYFLIVGQPLFEKASIVDLIEARKLFDQDETFRAKKLANLDGGLALNRLVEKLLAKEDEDSFSNMLEVIEYLKNIKDNTKSNDKEAQESYSRACSYNPHITLELVQKIKDKNPDEFNGLKPEEVAIKLHNVINLFIESDYGKSYLLKATQSKELSSIFFRHQLLFKEIFLNLLAEADYLWSAEVQAAWETTLQDTFEEVKIMYAEPKPEASPEESIELNTESDQRIISEKETKENNMDSEESSSV